MPFLAILRWGEVRFKEGKADPRKHGGLCKQYGFTSDPHHGHISFPGHLRGQSYLEHCIRLQVYSVSRTIFVLIMYKSLAASPTIAQQRLPPLSRLKEPLFTIQEEAFPKTMCQSVWGVRKWKTAFLPYRSPSPTGSKYVCRSQR